MVNGLDPLKTKWKIPWKIVENNKAENNNNILWDLFNQTDKLLANQPDIAIVNKNRKSALVLDISISSDRDFRKKEYEKLDKCRR